MRLVAVTADTSLFVAISLMSGRWDVVGVPDAAAVVALDPGPDVGVVDLRDAAGAFEAVGILRQTAGRVLPCVVVGDIATPLPEAVEVVFRPFTLAEFSAAVDRLLAPAPDPQSAPSEAPPAPREEQATALEEVAEEAPAALPAPAARRAEPGRTARWFGRRGKHTVTQLPTEASGNSLPAEPLVPEPPPPVLRIVSEPMVPPPAPLGQAGQPAIDPPAEPAPVALAMPLPITGAPDLEAIAQVLVDEVVDRLRPQAVALYVNRGSDGFEVVASSGLSQNERRLVVPARHLLFYDISVRRAGVLIAPVTMAQRVVAGVAGTWNNALMIAPLLKGSTPAGMIVVGAEDWTDEDLETLIAVAREASQLLGLDAPLV